MKNKTKFMKKIRYTFKRNLRNNFIRKDNLSEYGLRIFRYHYVPNQEVYKNIICFEGKAVDGIDFKSKKRTTKFYRFIKNLAV